MITPFDLIIAMVGGLSLGLLLPLAILALSRALTERRERRERRAWRARQLIIR